MKSALRDQNNEIARIEGRLLDVIEKFILRLHGEKHTEPPISLDSKFIEELGIDSLARMELLVTADQELGISVPDYIAVTAETPREWLEVCELRGPRLSDSSPTKERLKRSKLTVPSNATTLVEVLEWQVEHHGDIEHVVFIDESRERHSLTYSDLSDMAQAVAAGLRSLGLEPGQTVGIMLPTSLNFFSAYFGVLYAAGVPVPMYPPFRKDQIEDHLRRQAGILNNAGARILISFPEAKNISRILKFEVPALKYVVDVEELIHKVAGKAKIESNSEDTALIQYTSGSTGNPKGVVLSHANLLANIRAMGNFIGASSCDVFVSWLPLYHDMGLIGAWLGSLYYGARIVIMSPLSFIARPINWLEAISQYGGTLSGAPNFAYEICASKIDDKELKDLDLSTWRFAFNGAEPVSADTLSRFTQRFSPYGFSENALAPVYGLAENSVGLAFSPPKRKPVVEFIERKALQREQNAFPVEGNKEDAIEVVSCGPPLPGHEIRIVDPYGHEVRERTEGQVQFRGPSATRGYYNNRKASKALLKNGWLDTGDFGYIARGELFVTGRVKDLILRSGRNLHPEELESAVSTISGVRKGCVVVFGIEDPRTGTEKLIVAAETRLNNKSERAELRDCINRVIARYAEGPPDEVFLLQPRSLLKTPSGKIRRTACKQLYQQGTLGKSTAVWLQALRLLASGIIPSTKRYLCKIKEYLYALYCYVLLALIAPIVSVMLLLPFSLKVRRRVAKAGARTLLWASGNRIAVRNSTHIVTPSVVVANHSSYLDSILLTAVLPPEFVFVAKKELLSSFLLGTLLKRLGTLFVERFDVKESLHDLEALVNASSIGESLVMFPEGTFFRAPGLRPFHLGAFTISARAGVPVLPVAISGTRSVLHPSQWLPQRAPLVISFLNPIEPHSDELDEIIRLRNTARATILEHTGEPDLGGASFLTQAPSTGQVE